MTVNSPQSGYRSRLNIFTAAAALILSVLIPVLTLAQINQSDVIPLDCSVPENTQAIRPDPEATKTTVKIGFFLVDFKEIDDAEQTYRADIFFNETWNDPRLSEKALGRSLEGCSVNLEEVWQPPLINVNSNVGDELLEKKVRIDTDGNVNYKQRFVGEVSSDLNFKDFPFDEQVLHFIIAAYGPDAEQMDLQVDEDFTGRRKVFSLEGWDIELLETVITSEPIESQGADGTKNFARIDFRIAADRNERFYLYNIIMPLCLIVLMAWAVFWIDPSAIGPQVGLSTATVFTLIAFRFSLGFRLPKVPYFTRMDKFVLFSTILVFAVLGVAVATSRIASDGNEELAKRIERWARVIYLIVFVIILVFTLWL